MVANMESAWGSSGEELAELDRLQRATRAEAVRGRPLSVPVLIGAVFVFFASYGLDSDVQRRVAPMVWGLFVGLWVVWLRSGNRARARSIYSELEWRRDLPLWIGLFVAANVIVLIGASVSWTLAGALMALLCATPGLVSWRRHAHR